jgi:DNA modification methylase
MQIGTETADDPAAAGSYENSATINRQHEYYKIFKQSGQGGRTGALSRFPQNIGKILLLLFSQQGGVVVDPFAGHNSRMELCVANGHDYIGYDVSRRFMTHNEQRADSLRRWFPERTIQLFLADSRMMAETADAVGDFTITSPPYWDIENYGDEPEQLGKAKTYQQFLNDLCRVAEQNHRCLKRGAFCVWCVNDFRKNGRFYVYHRDVLRLLEIAGFVPWDIMIIDLKRAMRASFVRQIIEQQILPKRHEYALVVRK